MNEALLHLDSWTSKQAIPHDDDALCVWLIPTINQNFLGFCFETLVERPHLKSCPSDICCTHT